MQVTLSSLRANHVAALAAREAALDAVARLRKSTDALLAALATSPDRAMAVSVPFLKLCGFTIGGWLMARAADVAANKLAGGAADREFLDAKLASAHFFAVQVLPQVLTFEHIVTQGSSPVVGTDAALI
jgi:acyl-CoA dehydrogenase